MAQKIEKLTAFVSVDKDGDEGVLAQKLGSIMMPLIAADMERLTDLFPLLKNFKKDGVSFRILEFSNREDVTEKYLSKTKHTQ